VEGVGSKQPFFLRFRLSPSTRKTREEKAARNQRRRLNNREVVPSASENGIGPVDHVEPFVSWLSKKKKKVGGKRRGIGDVTTCVNETKGPG